MKSYISPITFFVCGFLMISGVANAANSPVPEPFQRFDAASKYLIKYDDLNAVYKLTVVDVGRSTRKKAAATQATTGTRMKSSAKRSTVNEGNRFHFEAFEKNEQSRQLLSNMRSSLEEFPAEVPLEYFSRDEQLAYWLNLYNITVLNEIINIYPKKSLKKLLVGKKSIFSKKLLTVAGVPLSLNDIQFTILKQNYDNDPLIVYGLYQGIIGGPNIRRRAFTGADVYRALKNNAIEFINSNRGTYAKNEKVFRVSSLYERNKVYFPDFNDDLSKHLLDYIEGSERQELMTATTLKPDINDWTITDLYGTHRDIGGSLASNPAALQDSVRSTTADPNNPGAVLGATAGYASSTMVAKAPPTYRISPELIVKLQDINVKREMNNAANATVTVEELGEVPVDTKPDSEEEN